MNKQQEFRKQTEEAKLEAFSLMCRKVAELEKENAELREGLVVGSTFNKALNSMNKNLEEERDKYRNMVFDKDGQLIKAKEIIREVMNWYWETDICSDSMPPELRQNAEQFLKEIEK